MAPLVARQGWGGPLAHQLPGPAWQLRGPKERRPLSSCLAAYLGVCHEEGGEKLLAGAPQGQGGGQAAWPLHPCPLVPCTVAPASQAMLSVAWLIGAAARSDGRQG